MPKSGQAVFDKGANSVGTGGRIFEFAEGSRLKPGAVQDAKAVGDHLEMLRKQFKGELTPKDVVDDARHDNSPLLEACLGKSWQACLGVLW